MFSAWCSALPHENIALALGPASGVCLVDIITTDVAQIAAIRSIVPPSVWTRTGGHGVASAFRWNERFAPFVIRDPETYRIIVRGFGADGQYTAAPPSVRSDAPSYEANCFLGDVVDQLVAPPERCYERLCTALSVLEDENRGMTDPRPFGSVASPLLAQIWRLKHQFAGIQKAYAGAAR